jgi:hypothetical protein
MATIQIKTNLSSRQKMLAIFLIFLSVLGIIIYFIIIPAIAEIRNLNTQIYNQRLSLEKKYTERFGMRKVVKNFREISADFSKATSIYIPQNGELDFITLIEEIADRNNIEMKIFLAPQEQSEYPSGVQAFDLTLTTSGNFKDIIKFLQETEKTNIYILIDNISFLKTRSTAEGSAEATIKGYVYKNISL